ncbi:sulfate adenylyltransferase [Polynucleobacter sp. 30F-ANTBAC]|uniref:sulfate adenylyltransferase subunit 1 n=1 Tax=Polynucleobacter sp. 30F-ANTBAC TaxID=2689095 RepID=UPI001C0C72E2|nr:GTP-binding protein [Polynucleobacter sp. 30F-ANTBAC]MBU3600399.1 sulfate adenylyltransferase [Polynucleobacter sp. 30F-ANTBAC]
MEQLHNKNTHGVVRFITCGSVDDGKSTLIGRLLYDTKAVLTDQIQALSKTKHSRVTASDAAIDLALLTDGLEAEREQGITIDVAYRYFSTVKRKFIVADAPGHEQYTRNMVTGASQADVAILLVDATRLDTSTASISLLAQTKRHAAIVKMLGLKHIAVAVNKIDLLNFDKEVFKKIQNEILNLAKTLKLPTPKVFPVSALLGDNIVSPSKNFNWYEGPTLLEWLEGLDVTSEKSGSQLRFPVQYVARQDGSAAEDFRGYLGRVESGEIRQGESVTILPAGSSATVAEIYISNGVDSFSQNQSVDIAKAGDVIAMTFVEDVDVSRGDMVVAQDKASDLLTKQLIADICWLDQDALSTSRKYILRHTTNTVFAKVKNIIQILDIETLSQAVEVDLLGVNMIGQVELALQKPIAADLFDESLATGSFVLIDEATNHTVAAGMIREAL